MKFKVFSVVLLGLCFLVLGVMSGAIPVTVPNRAAAEQPEDAVAAAAIPTARTMPKLTAPPKAGPSPGASPAGTDRPVSSTASSTATLTPEPTAGPSSTPAPTDEPAPSFTPASAVTPAPSPAPTDTPAPSPEPVDTPTPSSEPVADTPAPAGDFWEPEAVTAMTTITWKNDPINNETDHVVDGHALLAQPLDISLPEQGPQILIIHTHGTEAYTPDGADRYEALEPYRTTDADQNVTCVGQALGEALEEYGLNVLVDRELYDYPNYDGAYARSGEAIEGYLAQYPDLAMVIDLHRDAIGDEELMYGPISDTAEPAAAQMMFVMGSDGALSYPNWDENLALAMSLQGLLDEECPHLMRPTTLCSNRYNQQMTAGSLLLEVGATGNTLAQALAAVDLFAQTVGPALAERVGA